SAPGPRSAGPWIHVEGKVAIVTGGSRGIGEAIAKALGQSGAKVAIASRKIDGCEAAAERLRKAGVEVVEPFACHTGKTADVVALVEGVVKKLGKVDVLVNNAATNPHFGPMVTADDAVFDKTFEVNARGYFVCAREVSKHLIARNAPGSIINVASMVAVI